MPLTTNQLIEKNKRSTTSAYLALLDILLDTPVYVVCNNEDVEWNGNTYKAFPFQLGDNSQNDKETPNISIKVSNITREVGAAVSAVKGAGGVQVILRFINTAYPDTPLVEEYFTTAKTNIDDDWVSFTISVPKDMQKRFPGNVVLKDFCHYCFKDIECGYNGAATTCNKTLADCRTKGNSARFGGEIGIEDYYR